MSMLYDDGQVAIGREASRVLAANSDKARLLGLLEQTGGHDSQFWNTCIDQGWTALAIPEHFGGLGLGPVDLGLVTMACGAATAGAPFLLTGYAAAEALSLSGNADAQARWLSRLATGAVIGTIAFAEGNEVLPAALLADLAVRLEGSALHGVKPAVAAGLQSDCAVVLAAGANGPALVVAEIAGVARKAVDSFDNSRGYADLEFAGTPAQVLAEGEAAITLAREVLCRLAIATAHEQLGGAEAVMFMARDYALERKAFGQPIGAFQSVKHRLAELYGLVEIARANCIHAAASAGTPGFLRAAAAARISATEAYDTATRDGVQIHGGIGVTWEHGLHLHMRRSRSLAIECGNMFFWEDLLARDLAGEIA